MTWVLLVIVFVIICILMLIKKLSFKFSSPPQSIELKSLKGLKKISKHLDLSLSKDYMKNVEDRVKKEVRLKENEYNWRLVDLKRFFIMTSLLKQSPMFSEKVDELWHEMLMFTREYEDFSKKYLGSVLHHIPNVKETSNPDLRGFFDWIYSELFLIRKENIHLYKGFFKNPVNPETIDDFRNLPENELIDLYFKNDTKFPGTVSALISSMKDTAMNIKDYEKSVVQQKIKKSEGKNNYNEMLLPFLSVSYFHYDEFISYMKMSSDHSSSSTSCGAGSSCGSSCSSCGGGD